VFDKEGSYSIGTVVLDAKKSGHGWVGTGENNSQRSVELGDGIYRSDDGGATWHNLGLKNSEHIGRIMIDPRDSNVGVRRIARSAVGRGRAIAYCIRHVDGGKNLEENLDIKRGNRRFPTSRWKPGNPECPAVTSYQSGASMDLGSTVTGVGDLQVD